MRAGRATERTPWVASSAARGGQRVCPGPFSAPGWTTSNRSVFVEVLHGSTTGTVAEADLVSVWKSAWRVILYERDDVSTAARGRATIDGASSATPVGRSPICCPTFAKPKPGSTERRNFMATAARFTSRRHAIGRRFRKPSWRRVKNRASRTPRISTVRWTRGPASTRSCNVVADGRAQRRRISRPPGIAPVFASKPAPSCASCSSTARGWLLSNFRIGKAESRTSLRLVR